MIVTLRPFGKVEKCSAGMCVGRLHPARKWIRIVTVRSRRYAWSSLALFSASESCAMRRSIDKQPYCFPFDIQWQHCLADQNYWRLGIKAGKG